MAKAGRKKKEEVIDSNIEPEQKKEGVDIIVIPLGNDDTISSIIEEKENGEEQIIEQPIVFTTTPIDQMPEVVQIPSIMSEQAVKWERYIAMYRMTPESFLEKYPNHVNRKFIEEIISFKKENQ